MPKLLNINNYHYKRGGSDVVYFEHGEMFASRGWESGYFSMHHPMNVSSPWQEHFVDEIEMGQDYSLGQKVVMAAKVIHSGEAANKMGRLLKTFPADIAHLHCIYHHLSPSFLPVLKRAGVKTVMTAHDLKLLCPAYRMHDGKSVCERCKPNAVYNCATQRCLHGSAALSGLIALESAVHRATRIYADNLDRIVCPSRFYLNKFVEWGWPPERLTYIANACDVDAIETPPEPGDYFCYFGRLSFEKGLATLVRAAGKAGVKLSLVGDGPERASLEATAKETGAQVTFHGRQAGDALFAIVNGARACVLPSEWYENAPKSVLEAYGRGKIVLGADIGGISELVSDGKTGFLFPSGDIDALSDLMIATRDLPNNTIRNMGSNCVEFVRSAFTTEIYFSKMSELYADLLSH